MDPEKIEEFKLKVKKYMELDDLVKKQAKLLKQQKKERLNLYHDVLNFMSENNVEHCNTKTGVLKCVVRKSQKSVGKQDIYNKLCSFLKDEQVATNALNYIYENRETVEKTALRRIKPKKKLVIVAD